MTYTKIRIKVVLLILSHRVVVRLRFQKGQGVLKFFWIFSVPRFNISFVFYLLATEGQPAILGLVMKYLLSTAMFRATPVPDN